MFPHTHTHTHSAISSCSVSLPPPPLDVDVVVVRLYWKKCSPSSTSSSSSTFVLIRHNTSRQKTRPFHPTVPFPPPQTLTAQRAKGLISFDDMKFLQQLARGPLARNSTLGCNRISLLRIRRPPSTVGSYPIPHFSSMI